MTKDEEIADLKKKVADLGRRNLLYTGLFFGNPKPLVLPLTEVEDKPGQWIIKDTEGNFYGAFNAELRKGLKELYGATRS